MKVTDIVVFFRSELAVRMCKCMLQFLMLICVADECCKSVCAVLYNCLKVHCTTANFELKYGELDVTLAP